MRLWVVALVLVVCAQAHAGGQIGVVSAGDRDLHNQVAAHIEQWLTKQGHQLVDTPLSKDGANTLANCFVLDDLKCARGVIDARTKAISLVYAGVETDGKQITLTVYWFVKGRDPIGEKQTCDACTTAQWQGLVEAILQRLAGAKSVAMGKLALRSEPAGLAVVLDDVKIGATPIERDVPAGKHTVVLRNGGQTLATQDVDIAVGQTRSLSLNVELDEHGNVERPSLVVPSVLLASGALAAVAGSVMVYEGSKDDPDTKWIVPQVVPGGIALCIVGGGAVIGGGILLLKAGLSRSAPVLAAGPSGAYLGWVSRF